MRRIFTNPHRSLSALLVVLILLTMSGISSACDSAEIPEETKMESTTIPETTDSSTSTTSADASAAVAYVFELEETAPKKSEYALAFMSNGDSAVIIGGETSPFQIKGNFYPTDVYSMYSPFISLYAGGTDSVTEYAYSMDKTSIVYLVGNSTDLSRTLTYFDGKTATDLGLDPGRFCISSDGSTVAYEQDGSLYTWNAFSKETTLISGDSAISFVLSPTGKSIAYVTNANACFFADLTNADPVLIGSSCYPLALTDDGSTVYYYDDSGESLALCAFFSGEKHVLDDKAVFRNLEISYMFTMDLTFNRDCSQIIFSKNDGYYFSANGIDPIKVCGGVAVTNNYAYGVDDVFSRMINVLGYSIEPCFLPDKNLCNVLFRDKDTFTYFDEAFIVHTLPASSSAKIYLAYGSNQLILSKPKPRTELMDVSEKHTYVYVPDYHDPEASSVTIPEFLLWRAVITASGNVYYLNDIEQLFLLQGNARPVKIDTYVYDLSTTVIGDTTYIYYLKDCLEDYTYTLCCLEDSPGAEPVIIDTGVTTMFICDAGLVYEKNNHSSDFSESWHDIYFAPDGLHGEKVYEIMSFLP